MTIIVNEWAPDTCGCRHQYSWDNTVPAETRVHSSEAIVVKCARHSALAEEHVAHYARLMDENPRKNKTLEHVRKNAPPGLRKKDEKGEDVLIDGAVEWSFDNNHVLRINLPKSNAAHKKLVEDACAAEFGNGKVIVEV